jgi:hypothetical protein
MKLSLEERLQAVQEEAPLRIGEYLRSSSLRWLYVLIGVNVAVFGAIKLLV